MHESAVNARLKRSFPAMSASFAGVVPLQVEGMDAVAGELTIANSDFESGVSHETQAGAYAEADGVRFPAFSLQAHKALFSLMPGILGLEAVHVEGNAAFSRAYHLCAVHPQKTRALFNDAVVTWLAAHPGVRLESAGRGLLFYWPGRPFHSEAEGFTRDAAELLGRLADAQRNAPPVAPQDPRAAAAATPGMLGREMRKDLTTRGDLAAFLAQPPPRKLPANLERYCERRIPQMVPGIGLLFAMVGVLFAYGFGRQGDWKGILFGGAFFAIGAPLAFFFGRMRFRLKRLLRRGAVASARIEGLHDSGIHTSTAGALWELRLRYSVDGIERDVRCRISRFGIERARDAMDAQKPVRILYDPTSPRRVLFVDDLLTVSPEYES
jgi:hypothetical protein